MTKLQAVRAFVSFVCDNKVVIARDKFTGNNMGMSVFGNVPRLKLSKKPFEPMDEIDRQFRNNFISRCPMARGFSHITLSLLHECGHWATRSVIDIIQYSEMSDRATGMEEYMNIPYEHLATDWAIAWLCCPANRKVAKQFEKVFFGY